MPYIPFTDEQKVMANSVDLEYFLRSRGENLEKVGREYKLIYTDSSGRHDSITMSGSTWFDHKNQTGGGAIKFMQYFYGMSFTDAVQNLLGYTVSPLARNVPETAPEPKKEFTLPPKNKTMNRVYAYLIKQRYIAPEVVSFFAKEGKIYEDSEHHNAVFVGYDESGVPKQAHKRSTNSYGKTFRITVEGSDTDYSFAHYGTSGRLYVFEAPIDMLSYITLHPENWQEHSHLSLGGVAYKALEQFIRDHEGISTIYLCLDNDVAGEAACHQLNREIPEDKKVYRMRPPLKDWNELLIHKDKVERERWYVLTDMRMRTDAGDFVPMIRMSDVEQTEVAFLWKPYIPFGKLTILHGDAGNGKTYLAMQLCAACTNRVPIPNMEAVEPFNVIYQTAEDGLGDTIKPRLIDAGADLEKVLVIDEGEDDPLTLVDERIEKAIRQNNARLLIIDPIQAFLGEKVDMNRANEVRPILRKIGNVAQRTGCAIVLVGHLNKATGQQSNYRNLGSVDFNAGVRSVLVIGKTKDDPNLRVLVHDKSSLAPPGSSIAFILGDEEGFRWVGDYDITADELLNGIEKKRESKTREAKDLICALLAGGKEVLSEEIDRAAVAKGISPRTVRDAKKELGAALKSKTGEGRKKVFWME